MSISSPSSAEAVVLPTALRHALQQALSEPPQRVRRLHADGQALWLKQPERLNWRWRLQKGNSKRALERERRGLHLLASTRMPVAPIVAEGETFLATPDVGKPIKRLLRTQSEQGVAACAAAGVALATLHGAGFSHGRPGIRDICWDGAQATFIDLEWFSSRRHRNAHFGLDVFLFLHSILAVKRQIGPELYAAVAGYRQHAPSEAWAAARTWAWWLAGLGRLSVWIQTWRPDTGDVVAIPHTLQVLRNDVGRSTHYDNEGA